MNQMVSGRCQGHSHLPKVTHSMIWHCDHFAHRWSRVNCSSRYIYSIQFWSYSNIYWKGCRVARLRIVFSLPALVNRDGFPEPAPITWPTHPLAYITWFTHFRSSPDNDTGMYRVEPAKDSKAQDQGMIISLTDIQQSCMLTPSKATWDSSWTTDNILDKCESFFVNNLQSKYSY